LNFNEIRARLNCEVWQENLAVRTPLKDIILLQVIRLQSQGELRSRKLLRLTMEIRIKIRPAIVHEIPALQKLIEASVRGLQAGDYTPAQIDGALKTVFGVDTQLVEDGTYLVAEVPVANGAQAVYAGCGGWSKRKTLYGSDHWTGREDALLDPAKDAAKIRAFFIHPDWARRGVGSLLLEACEGAARAAGFRRFEMGATLTGAKLFGVKGYVAVRPISVPLVNGEVLPVIHMEKNG
jgi:GNAT superfamily N-acetyltransferase